MEPLFKKHKKRIIYAVIAVLAVTALCLYSYFVDTRELAFAPKCVFYQITGFKCPGCGTQRALHELAHANFHGVIKYNSLLLLGVPYLILLFYMQFFGGKERFPSFNNSVSGHKATLVVLVIVVAYWILRYIFCF